MGLQVIIIRPFLLCACIMHMCRGVLQHILSKNICQCARNYLSPHAFGSLWEEPSSQCAGPLCENNSMDYIYIYRDRIKRQRF